MRMGYLPIQLVLGVSVYSLGLVGGITSSFKRLVRGEINELTTMIYAARENAIGKITRDAVACGADDVAGIKTYVYEIGGGMIEFMAIGTAVKRIPGIGPLSPALPPQAIIEDRATYYNAAQTDLAVNVSRQGRSNRKRQIKKDSGPTSWWDVIKFVIRIAGG